MTIIMLWTYFLSRNLEEICYSLVFYIAAAESTRLCKWSLFLPSCPKMCALSFKSGNIRYREKWSLFYAVRVVVWHKTSLSGQGKPCEKLTKIFVWLINFSYCFCFWSYGCCCCSCCSCCWFFVLATAAAAAAAVFVACCRHCYYGMLLILLGLLTTCNIWRGMRMSCNL